MGVRQRDQTRGSQDLRDFCSSVEAEKMSGVSFDFILTARYSLDLRWEHKIEPRDLREETRNSSSRFQRNFGDLMDNIRGFCMAILSRFARQFLGIHADFAIAWIGIPTAPAWLPTSMLIKSEKLDYERI
ncbi:hypothetical protein M5K25_001182 [Dendrobium thyrsiflorum]|uniref:Uncharacterized protein n=1 Tax=Dendrobium thyrsiflorum TaxID=117978 RepID=A0ABD0VPN0_DENTH